MSAPCYNLIVSWPNGCENDSTKDMDCKNCDSWFGGYTCPSNDEEYYYRIDKGLDTGNYKPDMTKEETVEWFNAYKEKYHLNNLLIG